MKLIHCADIHLGSAMEEIRPEERRKDRQNELRVTFEAIASLAEEEGAAVLIAGDLFDTQRPRKKDKEFFYAAVAAHPSVDFLYLRGNHDSLESYTEALPNLKTFGEEWRYYRYGNVRIAGIEMTGENCRSLYRTYEPEENAVNIVMLHGQLGDSEGLWAVDRRKLRNLGIDYLALGHYHSFREEALGQRGVAVYSGCPEGRGFDETGKKGFVRIETAETGLSYRFVPFAKREAVLCRTDLTGAADVYEAYRRVEESCTARKEDMLRVELTGTPDFSEPRLDRDIAGFLEGKYMCVSVRDRTEPKTELGEYENDLSLRGEFIRGILSDADLSAAEKQKVLRCGLRALDGTEGEL